MINSKEQEMNILGQVILMISTSRCDKVCTYTRKNKNIDKVIN